ncbi:hypothetical protein [Brevifollis gellanilyticus]|uniref:Uncharacterized protein n=1 Tax=Brevifollis gellanilyticus TaxID=748831 RepID=A0A512M8N9_9BACT|nr:hypothetical protein [Brevifollis gellanilyticus]GEP43085.1 hypothetical protein BGE01nite_23760 [Brevifollis gellanilyticus]
MTKTLAQWGEHVQINISDRPIEAWWSCPFCNQTFNVAVRDTKEAGVLLAKLAFMDHMEEHHSEKIGDTRRSGKLQRDRSLSSKPKPKQDGV